MKVYYEAGGVTLYHADSRDMEMPEADLLLTDPMYGISYKSGHSTGYKKPRPGWDAAQRDDDWEPIAADDEPFDPTPWLGYRRVALMPQKMLEQSVKEVLFKSKPQPTESA